MGIRGSWVTALALLVIFGVGAVLAMPLAISAQTPASLSDETLLALVLPPLSNGSRPGVHLWARADQAQGPGALPTVFVVTLYTKQAASGPEEHEVVNYVQYSSGGWASARPRDDGALLVDDWAWISLNLTNLTAAASGQGSTSRYTVDYTASGIYAGAPRQIVLEEIYAADLSLVSSAVLSDTNPPPAIPAAATATPVARPPAPTPTPALLPSSPPRVISPPSSPTPGVPAR